MERDYRIYEDMQKERMATFILVVALSGQENQLLLKVYGGW